MFNWHADRKPQSWTFTVTGGNTVVRSSEPDMNPLLLRETLLAVLAKMEKPQTQAERIQAYLEGTNTTTIGGDIGPLLRSLHHRIQALEAQVTRKDDH